MINPVPRQFREPDTTTIKPTIGRIVWFYPAANTATSGFVHPDEGQPLAGIVAKVNEDGTLMLGVFDADGAPVIRLGPVPLIQEGQDVPEGGHYATWMPYQIVQAKKADGERQMAVAGDRDADDKRWRAGMLDMALRTPGLNGHRQVLEAAAAYRAAIEGKVSTARVETKAYGDGSASTGGGLASTAGQTFGTALCALKAGKRVARAGWNGKGMFVYLVPAASYPVQTGAAKAHFGEGAMVPYNAYLALKGVDDTVSTWAPSGSDALAEDWLIVE